jgi:hypothetical protein
MRFCSEPGIIDFRWRLGPRWRKVDREQKLYTSYLLAVHFNRFDMGTSKNGVWLTAPLAFVGH